MANGNIRTITCLLFLLLLPCTALAEFKGLLLLKDFSQFVVLDYGLSGQQAMPKGGGTTSSLSNNFAESYNAGVEYSILDQYIVNGHLKGALGLDQQLYSGSSSASSSGSRYSYDLDGMIFKISPTPANFSARSETSHLQNPFSKGYDVTTDSYTVGASFKHRMLGLRVGYSSTTSETSGTTTDTRMKSDQFMLRANNYYRNSKTDLQMFHSTFSMKPLSSSGTDKPNDISYSIIGNNVLLLPQSDSSFTTLVKYNERLNTSLTKNFSIGESFAWQLGKALTLGVGYENDFSSTLPVAGTETTEERSQGGTVSLSHQLYKSLSTHVKLQKNESTGDAGSTRLYGGSAGVSYNKKIFTADRLMLNYSQGFTVLERHLVSGVVTVLDEPLTVQMTATSQLQQPYVIPSSIIVSDQANPLDQYFEHTDYELVQNGAFTGFDFSMSPRLKEGQVLLIIYQYTVDANVNIRSDSQIGSAFITFQEKTYSVNGSFARTAQKNETGQDAITETSDSMSYTLGVTRNKDGKFTNIVYGNTNSEQLKSQYLEGTFRITRNFAEGSANAQIKDRHTWSASTSNNSSAKSQNNFSLNVGYNRYIFTNASLNSQAAYYRFAEANRQRNDVSFESGFRWSEGKLLVEAMGKVQYRNTNGGDASDEQLNLRITRYF
ncbi:MAG: hypothetical protein PHY09_12440 [Desulfuromonadaceae bacterium]|nr:hypothetical protein [Desulfuromonadaceae bacterium]MDD5106951.1 hypothetical protein [Desulfuromonadaceae bacterium]